MLGPYGNTLFSTFHFDRLAAQSMLLEFAFTDCPELLGSFRSLFGCRPGFADLSPNEGTNQLAHSLAEIGVESTLLTDEPILSDWSLAQQFDRVILNQAEGTQAAASDPSETALAEFFAGAIEKAALIEPGNFLWLHSQGLSGVWDAPYEMRLQFADEEDPDPPTFVESPNHFFSPGELEPDERLGFQQACAAQVVLIDQFLGILLEHLSSMPVSKQPLLVVTAPRGFPLGTGGHVGQAKCSLVDDSIQVPIFVRWPDSRHAMNRHQSLRYSSCITDFVLDWLGGDSIDLGWLNNPLPDRRNEYVLSVTKLLVSLRTHGWKFMQEGREQQLFVKPDDRWEMNDVLRKCRLIGEELAELCEAVVGEVKSHGEYQPRLLPERLAEHFS